MTERIAIVTGSARGIGAATARRLATDDGRTVLDDLDKRFARAEQHILSGLAPEDQAAFRALLATLATHVNSLDPVATACDAVVDIGTRAQP